MVANLINDLMQAFSGLLSMPFGKELFVIFISMLPIVELRGGLPVAISLGLNPVWAFVVCVIGNILPVPFILWFITPIFNHLRKTKTFKGFVEKMELRARSKQAEVEKWEFWGLMVFVAIPLPGTGAWTGALIASVIDMKKDRALLSVVLGVIIAGIIMVVVSLFVKGVFF